MGLDLIVEGAARPGHEEEWQRLLTDHFAGKEASEQVIRRWQEISIPGYQRIGAPRVGHDKTADDWICEVRGAKTDADRAAILCEFDGYYVLRLLDCDGVPRFSNGGFYDGADETSFRGAFLESCRDVLDDATIEEAWVNKMPGAAVAYGRRLIAAAEAAAVGKVQQRPPLSIWNKLGLAKRRAEMPLAEQRDIVAAAGRWFVFWGERGHPIRAWS